MQQYYTLEEAAQRLGLSADALRELAKKKQIRAFQDRGNWRFRVQDIDERARQQGVGSDSELALPDLAPPPPPVPPRPAKGAAKDDVLAVDFKLEDKGNPRSSKRLPKPGSDSEVRLVMDDDPGLKIDSDVKLASSPRPGKRGGDSGVRLDKTGSKDESDVKLVGDGGGSASDSDIRLHEQIEAARKKAKATSDPGMITEEIDLDAEEAKLKAKVPAPPAKPRVPTHMNPELPILPTTSPYELSEPDLGLGDLPAAKKAKKGPLQDSSSEHELVAFDESKARGGFGGLGGDLGSGDIPLLNDDADVDLGGLPAANAGNSGINLDDPADSGISLESGGSDELEFELSLDAGSTPKPAQKSKPVQEDSSSEFELSLDDAPSDASDSEFELSLDDDASSARGVALSKDENSDSEFELTLDDEGGLAAVEDGAKDIFEETNFDVPALTDDSGSQAVALEESDTDLESSSSDFELSMDDSGEDSGSQVVALDADADADDQAATVAKPRKKGTAAAPAAKAKTKAKAVADDEGDADEMELDFEEIEEKEKPKKKGKVKAKAVAEDVEEDEEEEEAPAGVAAPAEWGALPAVLLFPTIIVMFLVGLMGYELLQGAWGYHRSTKVARPIIDSIARIFDDTIPKE